MEETKTYSCYFAFYLRMSILLRRIYVFKKEKFRLKYGGLSFVIPNGFYVGANDCANGLTLLSADQSYEIDFNFFPYDHSIHRELIEKLEYLDRLSPVNEFEMNQIKGVYALYVDRGDECFSACFESAAKGSNIHLEMDVRPVVQGKSIYEVLAHPVFKKFMKSIRKESQ